MTRYWKHNKITHRATNVTVRWGSDGRAVPLTMTACGIDLPNVPWRNTQRSCIVDCMACLVRDAER
jgi:hypothetical protein